MLWAILFARQFPPTPPAPQGTVHWQRPTQIPIESVLESETNMVVIEGMESLIFSILLLGFLFLGFTMRAGIFFLAAIGVLVLLMLEIDQMLFYIMGAGLSSLFIFLAGKGIEN